MVHKIYICFRLEQAAKHGIYIRSDFHDFFFCLTGRLVSDSNPGHFGSEPTGSPGLADRLEALDRNVRGRCQNHDDRIRLHIYISYINKLCR